MLRASGATWQESADAAGCHIRTLRKYRDYPECKEYLKDIRKEHRQTAMSKIANALPAVADSLLKVALSEKTRDYAKVSACAELFKIYKEHCTDEDL